MNGNPLAPGTVVTWSQNLDRWEIDLNVPPPHVYAAPDEATCAGHQPCYTGSSALQDALDAVAGAGLVTVLGQHTASSSLRSGNGGAQQVTIEGPGGVEWQGGGGSLLAVGPGDVTVKGLTLTCQDDCANASAFSQTAGALLAYANNINGFGLGLSGSGLLRHNWWGAAATAGNVGQADAFAYRLGAAVDAWSESGALADSDNGRDAGIQAASGAGLGVIVSHGRGAANAPFGKAGEEAAPCSDYYDFFVVGGSAGSTWDVTLPVDNTAGCNAHTAGGTAGSNKLFLFALTGDGAPDLSCAPDTACWNLYQGTISRIEAIPPYTLKASAVPLTSLGGTPWTAGDENGADPNRLGLRRLQASASPGRWTALAVALLALAAAGLGWRVRRGVRASR